MSETTPRVADIINIRKGDARGPRCTRMAKRSAMELDSEFVA
jgi:hypothetical protein